MPKSKRNKEIELSKTKKRGMEWKKQLFEKIRSCVDSYSNVYVFSVNDMRNSKMKNVRDQWKDSRFFIGKNKIISMALGRATEEEYKNNLHKIGQQLKGERGLLFSNKPVDEVLNWFRAYSEGDFARSGHIATEDVTLKVGPLPMFPHNLEPYLRQLGLPTTLVKGVVHLIKDFEVCKKGEKLTPETARILKLLGHEMAEFHITIDCMWSDDGSFIHFTENPNAKEKVKKRKSKSKHNKDSSLNVVEMEVVETQDEDIVTDTNTNQIDDEEFSKENVNSSINDADNKNEVTSNDLIPNNISSAKNSVKKRKSKLKHNESSINTEEMELVEPQDEDIATNAHIRQIDDEEFKENVNNSINDADHKNEVASNDLTPNNISSAKKSVKKRKSNLKQNECSISVKEMEVVEHQNLDDVTEANPNQIVDKESGKVGVGIKNTKNRSAEESVKKQTPKSENRRDSFNNVKETEGIEPHQSIDTNTNSNQIVDVEFSKNLDNNTNVLTTKNEVAFKDITPNNISSVKENVKTPKSKSKHNDSSNLAPVENLSDKKETKNSEIVELNKRKSTDSFSSSVKISNNDLFNISADLSDKNIHASDEKSLKDHEVFSSTPSARVTIDSKDKPMGLEIETPVSKRPKKDVQDVEENNKELSEGTEKKSERISRSRKRRIIQKAKEQEKLMKTPESANTSQDSPIFRELRNRSVKVIRKKVK